MQQYNKQPNTAALPNLTWLSVKQAGVTAYDWLFCFLTPLALRGRPRITQRARAQLHHEQFIQLWRHFVLLKMGAGDLK